MTAATAQNYIVTITKSMKNPTTVNYDLSAKPTRRAAVSNSRPTFNTTPGEFYGEKVDGKWKFIANTAQIVKLNALIERINAEDQERDEDGYTDGTYAYVELEDMIHTLPHIR